MDFTEELLQTTTEAKAFSKKYLESRKHSAHCFNQLQVLLFKAGLHKTNKSPENKIIELLSDPIYGLEATKLNEEMTEHEATYKGLEVVIKAHLAHSSALQSIMKNQQQGELTEGLKNKWVI